MSPHRVRNASAAATIKPYDVVWKQGPYGFNTFEPVPKAQVKHYNPLYKVGDILIANNSDAKMMITSIEGVYYIYSILGTTKTGSAHIEQFDFNTNVFLVA